MSVSGISGAASNAGLLKLFQQRSQDLAALESAVQSGNITTAQQSLATLEQDTQTIQSTSDPSSNSAADGQSTGSSAPGSFVSDLTALLQAVQSGDTAGAQQDATAVEGDLQNASQQAPAAASGHHHHHHQMPQGTNSNSTASGPTTDTSATSLTDPSSDPSQDDTISLIQAFYMSN